MDFLDSRLFSAAILIVSGAATTYFVIKSQKEIASKRATLDVILKVEDNEYYQDFFDKFLKMWFNGSSFLHYSSIYIYNLKESNTWPKKDRKQRKTLDNFLNHYETISIGILSSILNEGMYKNSWRSSYVKHFLRSYRYIYYLQCKNRKTYENYSGLARKWMNKDEDSEYCDLLYKCRKEYLQQGIDKKDIY